MEVDSEKRKGFVGQQLFVRRDHTEVVHPVKNGVVEQTNFNSYAMVRTNESPLVNIVLVKSGEKPGGIGEPVTAAIIPALANAVAKLTGKRVRTLPITGKAIQQA
jgi:isoquinoline 1-oxidoreductase beta subunit